MSVDPSPRRNSSPSMIENLEGRMLLSGTTAMAAFTDSAGAGTQLVEPFAVKKATRTTIKTLVTSSTFGASVRIVATVARTTGATIGVGVVTFKSGTTVLGTASVDDNGKAVLNTGKIPVGAVNLTAVFNGTKGLATSASKTLPFSVAKSNTTTTFATTTAATATLGTPVTYVARVQPISPGGGIPTGSVQFLDGATVVATATLNNKGRAVYKSDMLFKGSHAITAKYVGTTGYNTSTTASAKGLTITEGSFTTTSTGLKKSTRVAGTGTRVSKAGDTLVVDYTGYLTNGTKFDSSFNPGREPFVFTLGKNPPAVIAGWEEGFLNAKPGETIALIVPPSLGYGSSPNGNIPANSTLYFIVNVIEFGEPELAVKNGSTNLVHNAPPSAGNGTAFGSVAVNASGPTRTFSLSNNGNDVLNFTANPPVVIGGANAGDFVLTQPVFSNGAATITVQFKPKAKGLRTAFVVIFTNDPDTPQFAINVSGTGA